MKRFELRSKRPDASSRFRSPPRDRLRRCRAADPADRLDQAERVRGLTTAACVWVTACIGAACAVSECQIDLLDATSAAKTLLWRGQVPIVRPQYACGAKSPSAHFFQADGAGSRLRLVV